MIPSAKDEFSMSTSSNLMTTQKRCEKCGEFSPPSRIFRVNRFWIVPEETDKTGEICAGCLGRIIHNPKEQDGLIRRSVI